MVSINLITIESTTDSSFPTPLLFVCSSTSKQDEPHGMASLVLWRYKVFNGDSTPEYIYK